MNSKAKGVIIFFLLIIVGFLCYHIVKNKDKNYVETPTIVNKIKKEYEDKDYVIDSAFSTNDVVFPYINLNYNGVSSINFQIKDLYEKNRNKITAANYDSYINDNILSVMMKVTMDGIDDYYTYNINMENGREIAFDEVYYKYSQADLALKTKIGDYIDNSEEIQSHLDNIVLTKEYIVDNSYNNYKINALSNNVKFFLGEKRDLNVVIKIELNGIYDEYAVFSM